MHATLPKQLKRNRDREGAGKSDHSWIKHEMLAKAAGAQAGAFRRLFPEARIVLIDGNAGDGIGVHAAQADLFDGARISRPTPRLLADLAHDLDATLCLCERDRSKRRGLVRDFPSTVIVSSHEEAANFAVGHGFDYALWLSDPCGPAGHGVEHMRTVALRILRSDFVVVFNEHTPNRFIGVKHSPYWQTHQKYVPMLKAAWWLEQLPKRYLARTPIIKQSPGFHFRVLVASDFLTDGVKRLRNVEIIKREGGENAASANIR